MRRWWLITGTGMLLVLTVVVVLMNNQSARLQGQVSGCVMSNPPGQPCPAGWTPAGSGCVAPNGTSCPNTACYTNFGVCQQGSCACASSSSCGGSCACCAQDPNYSPYCYLCATGNSSANAQSSAGNDQSSAGNLGSSSGPQSSNGAGSSAGNVNSSTNNQASSASSVPPLQASSNNSVANSAASPQPPTSSACSLRSQVPVVCGPAPSGCTPPADKVQPACSQRCVDAELNCRRNYWAQQSSWRLPAGCQYAEPFPNLYEACTRPRMECECNCEFNVVPSMCPNSNGSQTSVAQSSSKASAVGCPAGTSCMEEVACFQAGGTMDWSNGVKQSMEFCADKANGNWAGCCNIGSAGSSRSGSAGSEHWVYTDCPANSPTNPVLCVFGTPGQQTCPTETQRTTGDCKNTKYQNGVVVAQSVGICCSRNGTGSSRSGSNNSDGSRSSQGSPTSDGSRSSTTNSDGSGSSQHSDGSRSSTSQYSDGSRSSQGSPTSDGSRSSTTNSDGSRSSQGSPISDGSRSSSRYSDGSQSSQTSGQTGNGYCCVAGFCGSAPGCTLTQNQCSAVCSEPPPQSSAASVTTNNQCLGNECANGGNSFCGIMNQVCILSNDLPCIQCIALQGGGSSSTGGTNTSTPSCIATCSNNLLECNEECDDGNLNNDDGCSNTCQLENGFCGDSIIQSRLGEQCEPIFEDPGVCDPSTCRFYPSSNGTNLPVCGDGHRMGSEECDDGNSNDNDSCDNSCRRNGGFCGNGIIEKNNNEECEPSIHTSIQCSQNCRYVFPVVEVCTGQECTLGGDAVCQYQGQSCVVDGGNPICYRCETIISVTSASSSQPALICSGQECLLGGTSVCALENKICTTLKSDPCFVCTSPAAPSSLAPSSAGALLAFLNEACTFNSDCVTGLCRNGICAPCTSDNQCSSGLCRNGMCVTTEVLPSQTTTQPNGGIDPSLVLPASTIELPFNDGGLVSPTTGTVEWDGQRATVNGEPVSAAPSTPATGPAAVLIMISGAAAGFAYRRRK